MLGPVLKLILYDCIFWQLGHRRQKCKRNKVQERRHDLTTLTVVFSKRKSQMSAKKDPQIRPPLD